MQAKNSSETMLKMLSAKVDLLAASLNDMRELLHTGKHSAPNQQVCDELTLARVPLLPTGPWSML